MILPVPVTVDEAPATQQFDMNVQENSEQLGFSVDGITVVGQDKHYVHTQSVASARWEIHHNLHKYVSVTIVDSANTECIGAVQYIDPDTVVCVFEGAFSGYAYLN